MARLVQIDTMREAGPSKGGSRGARERSKVECNFPRTARAGVGEASSGKEWLQRESTICWLKRIAAQGDATGAR
jgi:hypothetical protein